MSVIEKKIAFKLKGLNLLMRDNDVLSRQLNQLGKNVKKARDYLAQSKNCYDKYKNFSKFSQTIQKEIIRKLEELERGNQKMNDILKQKLSAIQKTQKIDVNALKKIKPKIKKKPKKNIEEQNQNLENKNLLNSKNNPNNMSKMTFQEVQSMHENQGSFRTDIQKDKKTKYLQEIKKTQQEVNNYQKILLDLQLSKLNQNNKNQIKVKTQQQINMQDFYKDLKTKFQIPLHANLSSRLKNSYLESLKRMYYRNNSVLEINKKKIEQININ